MNSIVMNEACNKLLSLLSKLTPIKQKRAMAEMKWEIAQAPIDIPIRTEDTPTFYLDETEIDAYG